MSLGPVSSNDSIGKLYPVTKDLQQLLLYMTIVLRKNNDHHPLQRFNEIIIRNSYTHEDKQLLNLYRDKYEAQIQEFYVKESEKTFMDSEIPELDGYEYTKMKKVILNKKKPIIVPIDPYTNGTFVQNPVNTITMKPSSGGSVNVVRPDETRFGTYEEESEYDEHLRRQYGIDSGKRKRADSMFMEEPIKKKKYMEINSKGGRTSDAHDKIIRDMIREKYGTHEIERTEGGGWKFPVDDKEYSIPDFGSKIERILKSVKKLKKSNNKQKGYWTRMTEFAKGNVKEELEQTPIPNKDGNTPEPFEEKSIWKRIKW